MRSPLGVLWQFVVLLTVFVAPHSRADVDPDCFQGADSLICASKRVQDAKAADKLLAPVLAKAGWAQGCYTLAYIEGDNGGPDAITLVVSGPKGGKAPDCQKVAPSKSQAATGEEMKSIAAEAKKALSGAPKALRNQLLRKTDGMSVGNGFADPVEIRLP